MIQVSGISKSYGEVKAVRNLHFQVGEGELFGVIGPDGAGKTTLIRVLATLLIADSGKASINGLDVVRDYKTLRTQLGYMPGRFSLYQDLSIEENLQFFAHVFGVNINDNYDLIRDIYVQLEPFKNRRAGALSGGMKQKLALCCALIHQPRVLLLDEPGTGVDPVSRKEFWDMLKRLHQWGITILVSTPNMDEAELCDRIALLQHGEILAMDTPAAICKQYDKALYAVKSEDMYRLIRDLRQHPGVEGCYAFGEYAHLAMHAPAQEQGRHITDIQTYLMGKNHDQVQVQPIEASIEDCFIDYTR
jgi:ABC-2 type transport system ATP-binding protein